MKYNIFSGFLLLLFSVCMNAQTQTGSMLIKNGTVLTVTNGTMENTDVLIVDGKIQDIGQNLRFGSLLFFQK